MNTVLKHCVHKGSKYLVFFVVKSSRDQMCILFIAMFTSIEVAAMLNVRDISCSVIVMKTHV